MPRSRNAASNARFAESVSTVEPDLDETTSTVCSRPPASASPSIAASTWPGAVESRIDERHAGGLGDHLGGERGAAHAGEHDARDALGDELRRAAPRSRRRAGARPRPPPPSRDAGTPRPRPSGPHSDGSPAVMPDATRSATRPGRVSSTTRLDVSGQVDLEAHRASLRRALERGRDGVLQLVPGGDELLDALVLEHLGDVGEVDAGRGEAVEDLVRVGVGAGDGVAGDHAVVEGRLERLLGHRVHGAGCDELGDVERVGQRRVLDAGRGPQRTLHVGAGIRQRLRALGGELLLEQLVGEARVRDAGLALQRLGLVGADRGRGACRPRCRRARRRTRRPSGSSRGRCPAAWACSRPAR